MRTWMILFTDLGVAKELGYNADENLETFNCCVPSHLYIYLRGATSIK